MFTGIVQACRPVAQMRMDDCGVRLAVDLGDHARGLQPGASVAVNGACLTAASVHDGCACFDLIRETLDATNLGALAVGDCVNIERSLRIGDEVGGHILSGHIAARATVIAASGADGQRRITVSAPAQWLRYLMPKGFVALNGASLTIQTLDRARGTFDVGLIPETLARTTFGQTAAGDTLNLEVDAQTQAIVDAVRQLLPQLLAEQAP